MFDFIQKTVNDWIGLVGGFSAIITACFFFLQKTHIKRFESELTTNREKINKILESEVHAKKKLFDKEFEIYENLWELITELERETHKILQVFDTYNNSFISMDAGTKSKLKEQYINYYNETNYKIRKIAPFVPDDFYNEIGKKFGSFKWTVQSVEVQGNEADYLKHLDTEISNIRNLISERMKSYISNV